MINKKPESKEVIDTRKMLEGNKQSPVKEEPIQNESQFKSYFDQILELAQRRETKISDSVGWFTNVMELVGYNEPPRSNYL